MPISNAAKARTVVLTEELIRAGMKGGVGLKRQQARVLSEFALGGEMPLKSGWLERSIGKEIPEAKYKWFLKCKADEYLKPKKRSRRRK